ncbi:MAG: LptF/LptG family permease [Candidatus Eisenbacteria bacterium]
MRGTVTSSSYAGAQMKTLHRYILTQQIAPFLFGIFMIIFVLILDFLYKNLEILIGKGVPVTAAMELLGLSLGWMTVMAVPMAVLIGTLISFMRLASDNEIVAMRTSGLSLASISKPLIIASVLLSGLMIPIHNYVVPETNHRLANLLVSIHRKKPALQLREGVFMNDIKGYSILVNKSNGSEIEGVTISKLIERKPAQTIRAERGEIFFAEDGNTLVIRLFDGEIHDVDEKDPKRYLRLKFTEHTLNIPGAGSKLVRIERDYRGEREMSIGDLRAEIAKYRQKVAEQEQDVGKVVRGAALDLPGLCAPAAAATAGTQTGEGFNKMIGSAVERLRTLRTQVSSHERRIRSLSVEAHKKIAISFACTVFVLLGIPIGVRSREGGAGGGMVISIMFFAVYYAFLSAGEKLADRGFILPFLSMWAANIVLGGLGLYFFIRANKELPFIPCTLKRFRGGDST